MNENAIHGAPKKCALKKCLGEDCIEKEEERRRNKVRKRERERERERSLLPSEITSNDGKWR